MRTELEQLFQDEKQSYQIMVNPDLSDLFFWHFHPEFELVYITGASGTRHVGDHLSQFHQSDLVLIGSYIPHLNFDYGVKTKYEKRVVHFRPEFINYHLGNASEWEDLQHLFHLSRHGIAFDKRCQEKVGKRIMNLHTLPSFQQWLELLNILYELSKTEEKYLLHNSPVANQFTRKDEERLSRIYTFVSEQYHRPIEISEVASLSHLTKEAFCRYFKKMTKLTFTEFVNHFRIDIAKKMILQDKRVTDVCFASGFESLSYFNRVFKKVTGESPSQFRKRSRSI